MTTQVATTSATPDLEIIEGQITTTSTQVAAHFNKRHADVIRAIKKMEIPDEYRERNFALTFNEVPGPNGAVRKEPSYRITRDGFTLLAMGFTGKEAMQWKVAYLAAFNKMEAELLARTTRPANPAIDYDRISPAQAQDLKELVHAIVEAKVQGFPDTWARLHRKFRVNSYLELPASKFDEARNYLLGKLPEAQPLPDAQRLQLAFSVSVEAGAQVQRSVFEQLINGAAPDMVHARTIAAVTFDRHGKPAQAWAQAMKENEFITTREKLPSAIANRDVHLSDQQASGILMACAALLDERVGHRPSR